MRSSQRILEVMFLCMSLLSGLLLAVSLGSSHYFVIGGLGAVLAMVLVDWARWFRMPSLVANLLSFGVLYLSMRGFFTSETTGQLGAVANLLVYLQMLLLLQDKTPRQYWQLMVLSFLQVVVASVFHIQLEGGLLFLAYMAASAIFLSMLTAVNQGHTARQTLQRPPVNWLGWSRRPSLQASALIPEVALDVPAERLNTIHKTLKHVGAWILTCLVFAAVLFVLIPRSDTPWYTGKSVGLTMPGASRRMDLDPRGKITLNYAPVLKAVFRRSPRGRNLQLEEPPYFRSMALGSLVVENGNSVWRAPYDRIYSFSWEGLESPPPPQRSLWCQVMQEPNADSTIHTIEPLAEDPDFPLSGRAVYSSELSVIRRSESDSTTELLPFEFSFRIATDRENRFLDSFPYQHVSWQDPARTMTADGLEREWLTSLEPDRYPGLIGIARKEVAGLGSTNHYEIAKRLEAWFLAPGRFTYSLDYSAVVRREGVDSIEDFAVNHRSGHCEMFASALAVMLRSQGIPCRIATGFYGGNLNEVDRSYRFTGGHAHAWVEAFLAPEYCSEERILSGAASFGGAWLRLDPTPPSDLRDVSASGSDAINLARNLWNEYVLRLESTRPVSWSEAASSAIAGALDLSNWSYAVQVASLDVSARPGLYLSTVLPGILILGLAIAIRYWKKTGQGFSASIVRPGLSRIRRLLGNTLGVVAPRLGKWIRGETSQEIWFFDRLNQLLERHGIRREPQQTYLEFAEASAKNLGNRPGSARIHELLLVLTGRFQQVRFGGTELASLDSRQLEQDLESLGELLEAPGPGSGPAQRSGS